MQKVTPFLWFDQQAEDAARFYVSVFKDGRVGKPMLGPDGKVLLVPFQIQGQEFSALNGGPQAQKVMEAFMQMRKFDIAALERAAA